MARPREQGGDGVSAGARERTLRRLARLNRGILAGSFAGTALLAGAAALTFKGRPVAGAKAGHAANGGSAARGASTGGLRPPASPPAREGSLTPVQEEELATLERERSEPAVVSGAS